MSGPGVIGVSAPADGTVVVHSMCLKNISRAVEAGKGLAIGVVVNWLSETLAAV